MAIVIPTSFRFGIPDPMPVPPKGWAAVARSEEWFLFMEDATGKFYMPEFLDNGDIRLTLYRESTPGEQAAHKIPQRYVLDQTDIITLAQGWTPPSREPSPWLN